jgi:hypothetical protein
VAFLGRGAEMSALASDRPRNEQIGEPYFLEVNDSIKAAFPLKYGLAFALPVPGGICNGKSRAHPRGPFPTI